MALRGTDQPSLIKSLEAKGVESTRRALAIGEHGDVGSEEFSIVERWLAMALASEAKAEARAARRIAIIAMIVSAVTTIAAAIMTIIFIK